MNGFRLCVNRPVTLIMYNCMKQAKKWWMIALAAMICSCQKELHSEVTGQNNLFSLKILFNPMVDTQPLQFNNTYTNIFNEPYSVKTFKFYISQIDLINADSGITYKVDRNNYYLVNEADTATAAIRFTAASHHYNQLAFVIGVDSVRNVSGAQTGALDPANGMFWTWNSGYIMAKLEGSSPLSTQPDNRIEYHIGGFREPYNVLRRIVLPLPAGQVYSFPAGAASTINITANVNAWFHNPHDVHIAQTPVWMTPGDTSVRIAENYSKMFMVTNVTNN